MNADAWKLVTDLANTKIEEGVRQREEALMREFISKVVEQFNLEPGHEKVLWSIAKECSGDVTPMSRIPRCIFKGRATGSAARTLQMESGVAPSTLCMNRKRIPSFSRNFKCARWTQTHRHRDHHLRSTRCKSSSRSSQGSLKNKISRYVKEGKKPWTSMKTPPTKKSSH